MGRYKLTIACYCMALCAMLQILAFLFTHWSIRFKAFVSTSMVTSIDQADSFFVEPIKYIGKAELTALEKRTIVRMIVVHVIGLGGGKRAEANIKRLNSKPYAPHPLTPPALPPTHFVLSF
jgi:hypothetical protein